MDFLVFRTAIPFGYLFAALAMAVLFGGALLAMFIGAVARPRRRALIAAGGIGVGLLALVVWANLDAAAVDWNPRVRDASELLGTWNDGSAVLELRADGSYTCRGRACDEVGATGAWSQNQDFYVSFTPPGRPGAQWRLTARDGRLQFASGDTFSDPDVGDPHMTFKHAARAP